MNTTREETVRELRRALRDIDSEFPYLRVRAARTFILCGVALLGVETTEPPQPKYKPRRLKGADGQKLFAEVLAYWRKEGARE